MAEKRFAAPGIRWPGLWIISGYRDEETQTKVNPTVTKSCHRQCPSLAADLRLGTVEGIPPTELWAILGGMWKLKTGGRWGGDFDPYDPNHFDFGPCGLPTPNPGRPA